MRSSRAFTMVEVVVVVAIIAVLSAVAVPRAQRVATNSKLAATAGSFRNFTAAIELYRADHRTLPPDYTENESPTALGGYLRLDDWVRGPATGGKWDWNNTWGIASATGYWDSIGPNLSIKNASATTAQWRALDRFMDDGNLTSGAYRTYSTFFYTSVDP